MAFPSDTFTGTGGDLDVMMPLVWGERINDFFKDNLIAADFFVNRSEELMGGGDSLTTPNITEMSANSKTTATAVTLNSPTETAVTLTVDTWQEVSFAIEDIEAAQVKRSYVIQETYAKNAGYTVAAVLEDAIMALFSGFSNTVGASTTDLADSEIREAIATLEGNSVPGIYTGDVAFFVHPNTFWKQIQGIDKFSLAINSPVNDPTAKKPAGSLYGIPVFVSPRVPNVSGSDGRYNVLAHRDAIHFATHALGVNSEGGMVGSGGVRVQANYIPDYLSTLVTADIAYGVVENRDNAAVAILSDD